MDRVTQHHMTYRRVQYGFGETDDDDFFDWRRDHKVTVGHDVWIGHGAILLPGVTVGTGAVIGAGAVVTKDVEPYTIAVGVPARPLRRRFPEDVVEELHARSPGGTGRASCWRSASTTSTTSGLSGEVRALTARPLRIVTINTGKCDGPYAAAWSGSPASSGAGADIVLLQEAFAACDARSHGCYLAPRSACTSAGAGPPQAASVEGRSCSRLWPGDPLSPPAASIDTVRACPGPLPTATGSPRSVCADHRPVRSSSSTST